MSPNPDYVSAPFEFSFMFGIPVPKSWNTMNRKRRLKYTRRKVRERVLAMKVSKIALEVLEKKIPLLGRILRFQP